MRQMTRLFRLINVLRASLALGILSSLSACTHLASGPTPGGSGSEVLPARMPGGENRSQALGRELAALDSRVRQEEAVQVAICACDYSRQLARDYCVVRPALFHNLLVNMGVKDLLTQLQTVHPVTLALRWGIARAGTYREHNCLVVTAQGQPFREGIVLDPWRHSGQLTWVHVSADSYPWQEGELTLSSPSVDAASTRVIKPR